MSKQAHLADGTILEFPDETTDAVIDATVKRHIQAAKFPTSAEQGGKPGRIATPLAYQGVVGRLAQLGHAMTDTMPGAQTWMDTPAARLLGAAIPGGKATEAMGVGQAIKASPAVEILKSLRNAIPSIKRAGAKFDTVMTAAKDVPIDTTKAEEILARAKELRSRGSTLPKVMNDFAKNRAAGGPMTYEAGRDFASNAGALSTREITAMNAKMQRQVAQFSMAMKESNRAAAEQVGMGKLYDSAMKEYRQAKTIKEGADILKKWAIRAAIGVGGYSIYRDLTK